MPNSTDRGQTTVKAKRKFKINSLSGIPDRMQFRSATTFVFIMLFGSIGVYILQTSHAATSCGNGYEPVAASAQCIARQLMNEPPYNWHPAQTAMVNGRSMTYFACLQDLWNQESGWRWNAQNASTLAYGIPQALPANQMASVGANWQTNAYTQIRWGLDYVRSQYGTPCNADRHEQMYHWYGIDKATGATF